jgi:hypothetical protein
MYDVKLARHIARQGPAVFQGRRAEKLQARAIDAVFEFNRQTKILGDIELAIKKKKIEGNRELQAWLEPSTRRVLFTSPPATKPPTPAKPARAPNATPAAKPPTPAKAAAVLASPSLKTLSRTLARVRLSQKKSARALERRSAALAAAQAPRFTGTTVGHYREWFEKLQKKRQPVDRCATFSYEQINADAANIQKVLGLFK